MDNKEKQEISLIGRLFSMEALLILMGLFSLVSGIRSGKAVQIFWGVAILVGAVALYFVKKKDWKKHWEEEEARHQAYQEHLKREKEKSDGK
jgi:flagellar biosynthesis component FlhA